LNSFAVEGRVLQNGAELGLSWGIPFLGLLVTIALGQALWPGPWGRHYGKVTAIWIVAIVVPLAAEMGAAGLAALARLLLLDYLPFVVSIFALYVIAGGIHIRTRMCGHPGENALLLAIGTLAGGLLGTPGTTLLFLPVLLTANRWRRHKVHSVLFLIFLVCNMGGALSPIGPPLLVGYLSGVSFLWTVKAMLLPTTFTSAVLICTYFALDSVFLFPREDPDARAMHRESHDVIMIDGTGNLWLLAAAIGVQILCGNWHGAVAIRLGVAAMPVPDLLRLIALPILAWLSLRLTPERVRKANEFSWEPMKEVGILFAGIFATVLPLLLILEAGVGGALGGLIRMATAADGRPIDWAYFATSGALSSILDNAPTFLVFFNAAGGDPVALMGAKATTLTAISAGAAFWGGVTYIGNAPNLMARSIAQQRGVAMPNFLAYMVWSGAILLPSFALTAWVFFT
jgi:Na+/H+ antiporter NhaD/arsenite permease-like protein